MGIPPAALPLLALVPQALTAVLPFTPSPFLPSTEDIVRFLEDSANSRLAPLDYLNTKQLITARGYGAEEYKLITEDGYILKLTRILGQKKAGIPVLIMHGVIASSEHWLLTDREHTLAFMLVDAGYDVWLGDQRGNTNSKSHVSYSPKEAKFWDFSFHEAGLYDLPAMMDQIKSVTGSDKIHYVGHSMGTTVFLVMASSRPEYASRVGVAVLLAPVATVPAVQHRGPLNVVINRGDEIYRMLTQLKVYEFLPRNGQIAKLIQAMCSPSPMQAFCIEIVGLLAGENRDNWDMNKLGYYLGSFPSGTSSKNMHHFSQIYRKERFMAYDYGSKYNFIRYGSEIPPDYNLGNITTSIGLYYGVNDRLMDVRSADLLAKQLPNVVRNYIIPDPKFSHLDFVIGLNSKELVYDDVLNLLNSYSN